MKRTLIYIILTFFLISFRFNAPLVLVQTPKLTITLNGEAVVFPDNQEPFIENGTTLIPMRIIFEILDANVTWDNATRSATSNKDGKVVVLKEDSDTIIVNGANSQMPTSTRIKDGFMFVPLRSVSEAFDANVLYNSETYTISINLKNNDVAKRSTSPNAYSTSALYQNQLKQIDSVVYIEVFDAKDKICNNGSGVIISEDGIIAMCYHTIEGCYSGEATLADGRKFKIENILSFDKDLDLALVKISGTNFKYAQIGDSDNIKVGDKIMTISNPDFLAHGTISEGIISAIRKEEKNQLIQITASISRGGSGGGLFDIDGKLVGIVAFGVNTEANLNFCSAINLFNKLKENIAPQKLYEINNTDTKPAISKEELEKALLQKFSTITLGSKTINLTGFQIEKSDFLYLGNNYEFLTLRVYLENENFKKYCDFLAKDVGIDTPAKIKLMEKILADMWFEIKKEFHNYNVTIEMYASGYDTFEGQKPFFKGVDPNDYKFDYDTNKFKYKFEFIHLMDDYNGYLIFHKYNFIDF